MSLHANNPKPQMTRACVKPADLPEVNGKYITEQSLSGLTWFRVGGVADVIYLPTDADDLSVFLKNLPADIPVTVLGAGSNTLARDGGVRGVVIRLGRGFADIACDGATDIRAGAGALDVRVAATATDAGLSGLEFLSGIPGSIGGAVAMNAGAYGRETADVLVRVEAVTLDGEKRELTPDALNLGYRTNGYPDPVIYTAAVFRGFRPTPALSRRKWTRLPTSAGRASRLNRARAAARLKIRAGQSRRTESLETDRCRRMRGLRVGERKFPNCIAIFLSITVMPAPRILKRWAKPYANVFWKPVILISIGKSGGLGRWLMAPKSHIAVLQGAGRRSAKSVLFPAKNAPKPCNVVVIRSRKLMLIVIWLRAYELAPDVCFNALHGVGGEDGEVQGLLEVLAIPYTHSGVRASALAMDKHLSKKIFADAGLPVAQSLLVMRGSCTDHPLDPPYVVKPVNQGSSVGVQIVPEGANELPDTLTDSRWGYDNAAMVEAYIAGRELTCAVLDDAPTDVMEIVPTNGFYVYRA